MELVVTNEMFDETIDTIIKNSQTGEIGDGKIFISDISDCIRIRTHERGEKAI